MKPIASHLSRRLSRPVGAAWLCALAPALVWTAAIAGWGAAVNGTAAPENATPAAPTVTGSTNLLAAQAAIRASLADAVVRAKASETVAPPGIAPQDALIRRTLLQRLVRVLEQQLSDLSELEEVKSRRAAVLQEAQTWKGFALPGPYSVTFLDGLREASQAERLRMEADKRSLSALDDLIAENREAMNRSEERIRRFNEQLEGEALTGRASPLAAERELEQIRGQVAVASVALLDLERQIRQESLAASRAHLELLQRQLILAGADTRFTQADLERVLAGLELDRVRLETQLLEAERGQSSALAALEAVRSKADNANAAETLELIGARTAQWETAVAAVRGLRLRLEIANLARTLWELRFAGHHSRKVETLRESERRLQILSRRAGLWQEYFHEKLETTSAQLALEEARLNDLPPDSDRRTLLLERLAALRQRDQWLLEMNRCAERFQQLLRRWDEDLQRDIGRLPFGARVEALFFDAGSLSRNLWTFELFTAEDAITVDGQKISGKRSVTVGKILSAILILVVGYWVIGLVSRVGSRLLQKWLKVEPNQGELIRRWMRAVLVVCLLLFSLVSVKIPLTVFAFAGGALAIGVGFGMQTVLKNVVSGLIILFERPFRVGDVLDVAGQKGALTSIGLRASVLQLWDGTETLFPNSNLLENALTNWTYSTRLVRFALSVGVAYGSDTRRVVLLLEQVLERHGQIEKQPKPQVFFTDFGPSALCFEVRFWLDVLKTNPAQVASDLRHMIAGVFREHGIVIALPQADLHLDSTRPFQVEVLARSPAAASPLPAVESLTPTKTVSGDPDDL